MGLLLTISSSKQSCYQTKANDKKRTATGCKRQRICTLRAVTRNKIAYKMEPQNRKINRVGGPKHNTKTISTFCLFTKKRKNLEQRRPVQAKPDFKRLSGPKNGTSKRTYGIGCLCSLAPMWQLRCSTTHAAFTNASLLRLLRYSATPRHVSHENLNVNNTISKTWGSKQPFKNTPSDVFP